MSVVEVKQPTPADVVRVLEQLLAMAKANQIRGVMVCTLTMDGGYGTG